MSTLVEVSANFAQQRVWPLDFLCCKGTAIFKSYCATLYAERYSLFVSLMVRVGIQVVLVDAMDVSPDAPRKRTPLDLDISGRRPSCLLWVTERLAQAIDLLALVFLPPWTSY